MKNLFIIFAIFVITFSTQAKADVAWSFARIACVENANILDIGVVTISGDSGQFSTSKGESKSISEKNQYYLLTSQNPVEVECELGDFKIKVVINETPLQATGGCGGDPGSFLTLFIDELKIIDNVRISPSCYDPHIDKLTIFSSEYPPGDSTAYMELCGFDDGYLYSRDTRRYICFNKAYSPGNWISIDTLNKSTIEKQMADIRKRYSK